MDWSEKVLCIKCNKGGNLMVCSEDGCPLAVHEGCMGCPARFDDEGRYYCPYCSYKQAVAESRKARESALATKKALMLFMNDKVMEEDKRAEDNRNSESTEKIITCSNGSEAKCDASLYQSMQPDKEQKIGNAEEEKVQKEESEGSSGPKAQDPSPKLQDDQSISNGVDKKSQEENQSISNVEETMNQEEEHETSAASSGQNPSRNKHNTCDIEEGKIQEEICETLSPSTGEDKLAVHARTTRQSTRKKAMERDSEAVSPPTYPTTNSTRKSSRRSSSALETKKGSNRVVHSPKRLKQPEKSPVKLASDQFGGGKRKRIAWTEKEEEALKEGVEFFPKKQTRKSFGGKSCR
ncbi:hypothetical protein ACS0TY_018440 [Phlomoides rotata]